MTVTTTTHSATAYPQFAVGETVRTIFGETRTVLFQNGCQVFVVEEPRRWYHPTKLFHAQ